MNIYEGLDSWEVRRLIINEIVDNRNEDILPISSFDHESDSMLFLNKILLKIQFKLWKMYLTQHLKHWSIEMKKVIELNFN